MQKLIKINENHYLVVDDSEINGSDWVFNEKSEEIYKITIIDEVVYYEKKITHSTQPLEGEFSSIIYKGYNQISLQEVKELIGEVDVEKKAETKYPKSEFWVGSNPSRLYDENAKDRRCFLEGYNQALEDNKEKKYTDEDIRKAFRLFFKNNMSEVDEIIQSLQPKTEWEVEFIDGKLKLK